ncbi:MAG: CDP-alcohol phosphatidyltransferase family protein [Nitrospirae bacterium]|nr:MAG: CDP-alcohol phosphatidyltransferase family protein [Nitrospirota bacterium]
MISAWLGHFLDKPLEPLARRVRVNPNLLTITGFLITTVACLFIPWQPLTGGVLILLGGAFDMFDGIVARTNGKTSPFGAFLDSVLDRYSDSFIFLSISYLFILRDDLLGAALSLGTLIGALLISYARARAEGLGLDCHTGLMERPERIILVSAGCITGYIVPVIWALFILTHITVIQRILHVRKRAG